MEHDMPMELPAALRPPPTTPTTTPPTRPPIDPSTGAVRRGRGRPPGSKNKATLAREAAQPPPSGPARMQIPSGNRNPPTDEELEKAKSKKEEKLAKAEQYASYIKNDLNDKFFMLIIGTTGMDPSQLFTAGHIPVVAQKNPAYTDFGNAIAIPADLADNVGKLLAELESTGMGQTVSKVGDNANVGLVLALVGTVYSTYRYSKQIEPFLAMLRKAQEAKAAKAAEGGEDNVPSD